MFVHTYVCDGIEWNGMACHDLAKGILEEYA